jgi:hypothetical protein
MDQTFEYEFKDDDDIDKKTNRFFLDDDPKLLKQPREAGFSRPEMGNYKIIHRQMLMEYTSEEFVLTYFHGDKREHSNIQCLQPIRGNIREQLPGPISHKE